ncbi:hypothetical protein QL285_022287 [Trifolium repens]|nr:hypothetical protein QL285_022287 [Trifolium repens]
MRTKKLTGMKKKTEKTNIKATTEKKVDSVAKTEKKINSTEKKGKQTKTEKLQSAAIDDNASNSNTFSVVFNHGGEFVREDNNMFYRGGVQTVISNENADEWCKAHLINLVMGLGYEKHSFKIWTRCDGFADTFTKLVRDDDIVELAEYICGNNVVAQMYVEHDVSDEGSDDDSDYDIDEDMKFSDSEDERGLGLDDGFMDDEQNDNDVENNMKMILSNIGCNENENDFDDKAYESEELGSSDPDASDDERGPRYEKFRKEHMNANFKFKFGMKFNSMQEFRDAMRDWSSLNGQPLDWVKNDRRHAVAALGLSSENPIDFVDECYTRDKYAKCYGFAVSAINGVDMWPKPPEGVDENILPPMYKNGPGRPRKLRIREVGEEGARRRRKGVVYFCTKCKKPGHNASSCKSKTQDPNGLKRKRKPPKGKGKEAASSSATAPTTQAAVPEAAVPEAAMPDAVPETVTQENVMLESSQVVDATPPDTSAVPETNASDQVGDTSAVSMDATHDEVVEASQVDDAATHDQPSQEGDFFDDIADYEMLTLEEIIARDIQYSLKKRGEEERVEEQSKQKKMKIEKVKAEKVKVRGTKLYHGKQRRSSERINARWDSKPIVGVGSSETQPIVIKENDEDAAAKLGTCFRSLKSWKNLPKKN